MTAIAVLIGFLVSVTFTVGLASINALGFVGIIIAMVSAFFICAGGQAINDVYDSVIDKKINPKKPIPSKRIKKSTALHFSQLLFIIGVLLATTLGTMSFLIALVFAFLLIIYSSVLYKKKYYGNIIVALGTAITFVFGASITGMIPLIIIFFALSAFFINMSREVTKDFEDLKKDKGFKVTLPMLKKKGAKLLVVFYYEIGVLFALAAYIVFNLSYAYLLLVLIAIIVFYYAILNLHKNSFKQSQKKSKKGMLLSLLAYISTIIKW